MNTKLKLIKHYIKLNRFLEDYCGIKCTSHIRHKMRGKDSAGNKIDFTVEEYKAIAKGWRKLRDEINDALKK